VLVGCAAEHLKVGQLSRARAKALEALTLDQQHLEARMLLSKVYIEEGHYGRAIAELEQARTQAPKSAEVVYLLGVAQEKAGKLDDALKSYRRAYVLDSTTLEPVKATAEVLVAMGRINEAQVHIDSYTAAAHNDPGMFELAGRLAMMRGQYTKAVGHYEQAHDLDHENLRYREALARAQFFAGKHSEAKETLELLADADGYEAPAWVYNMLGDCHMAIGRPFEARDAFRTATDLSPTEAGVWANLARACLALDEQTKAVSAARQALYLDAKHADASLVLGYALLRAEQIGRALKVLSDAAAMHPDNGTLLCLLGRAHAAAGDETKAIRCYKAALRAEPENELAKGLLSAVDEEELPRP
jgi:superkiller protein 3